MAKKPAPVTKSMTKSEILADIAETTGLSRKQVASVLDSIEPIIERHLKSKSMSSFTLPGLLKVKAVKRPARKAQKGVPNPFKPGETMDVPAKPASIKIKILPLKKLKSMVA